MSSSHCYGETIPDNICEYYGRDYRIDLISNGVLIHSEDGNTDDGGDLKFGTSAFVSGIEDDLIVLIVVDGNTAFEFVFDGDVVSIGKAGQCGFDRCYDYTQAAETGFLDDELLYQITDFDLSIRPV